MARKQGRIGLWLIGATGRVGSATALGVAALRGKRVTTTGLVSELPPFRSTPLAAPGDLVIGGHEIRSQTLLEAVHEAHEKAGIFDEKLIRSCTPLLRSMQRNIVRGTLLGSGSTVRRLADDGRIPKEVSTAAAIERLADDIRTFRRRQRLDDVIVVNVASTEPPFALKAFHARWLKLQRGLTRRGVDLLPASSIYALAAIEAGCPFINFTPSLGIHVPALQERAYELGVPSMGCDGKTGETLVKSVLAPMFAMRNLEVLSWVGQNILGNRDGEVLKDPRARLSKIRTKDKVVSRITGHAPTTHVSIHYVPSLDDWKVAWDFIHFEGFLGTKMAMQFTWSGCDSILAAPLVLDLARFAALEHQRGGVGPMRHLAFFFKDPMGVDEHDLPTQWRRLIEHVCQFRTRGGIHPDRGGSPRGAKLP